MTDEIILEKAQFINALTNCHTLVDNGIVLETSNVGLGKSIMLSWILTRMRNINKAIMICTSSLTKMWEKYKEKYNLPFILILSYESLRSTKTTKKDRLLKHNLLTRKTDDTFEVTEYYMSLVEDGLVICCDESQKSKNSCDIQQALKTMCSYIQRRKEILPAPDKICGLYFMSTTPCDKEEHLINFCYTCGIIKMPTLIDKVSGKLTGLRELKTFCSNIDLEKTNNIFGTMRINYKNAENIAYRLCTDVLLPKISSFIGKKKLSIESTAKTAET